ncbi:MAG: DNA polymerase III subunit alpha [Candidatus Spechtbacteria bacterium RIFCSPHIGHO2_02_FULL_43_15b]|uniref:DNA polymerase III subunit alpha n=1 Tax=Candidatus Spechtbacteria bacterium RIFCSPHIGHO2_01_FULL_43_30 TaxID=1802158 RepID=A0A1G2H8P3_9BACT|nr:MAG: DNA polymerase III subunit alpha [Candidatus Spechtbacteria bacterium RIFCSPHIGHO2_01_FULL_43_30]OGZ59107.1 MAG: DNA polymerase III subunit alpha [Candidatus Spechtbacteria bacterium RIFCSPHIGHO2_02_FULL_43_15b]
MASSFTHLHVHSHYSLLDGLSKIPDLLDYAKKLGMDSVALTDHGAMYGIIEFYKEAKKRGIKPILGIEAYIANRTRFNKQPGMDDKRYHLTLLAKTNQGYKNLIKLSSKSYLEGYYYKPRMDKDLLREYSSGIIALSGCLNGEIPKAILGARNKDAERLIIEYSEIFKDNFYLELQHHPNIPEQQKLNKALVEYGKKFSIPLVATQDSHYLHPEDAEAQDILLAIQTGEKITDPKRGLTMKDEDFSLKSSDEMRDAFKDTPEAFENTAKIADQCDVEIELGKNKLPYFEVPDGYADSNGYLKKLCLDGLKRRFDFDISKISNYELPVAEQIHRLSPSLPKHKDSSREPETNSAPLDDEKTAVIARRLDYELGVIRQTGFAPYFLIVQDFINWAKNTGIVVGPGRGSAAGSLVSYLLNITNVDPLKYDLIFERFLQPERNEMPDIDVDFADTRRDEVLEYVAQKYGRENVSQIITFGTMAARAAIRDVGRVLNYPYDFCDKVAKTIPMMMNFEKALKESQEFATLYTGDSDAKRLIDAARKLEGVARHASTHACGVVISKEPLSNITPLQLPSQNGAGVISQYEMHAIESLGLLKMDFLGLKNLTIIEKTLDQIRRSKDTDIDITKIPLDDEKTLRLFRQANTTGVFQLESSGMKRYLKELKPSAFEDIIAMIALYRPGPMELIPDFINRKHGKTPIEYLHPKLEPILKNTYGIAVYQEQVLEIARELAGFTYSEADVLRKAIGKKIKELLEEQREKFIKGIEKNGLPRQLGERLFQFIEPFARYGFNRAHSTCYATIGWQTAYLKAHYPTEFMAALLNAEQRNIDRISFLIDECRDMKISVLPPDINESQHDFTVSSGNIRFGLAAVKNVGDHIVEEVIKERNAHGPYASVENMLERVQDKDLNKKSLESLIKCGAFDKLDERNRLLQNIDALLKYSKDHKSIANSSQISLFQDQPIFAGSLRLEQAEPAKQNQMLAWEKELLGFYLSSHPLEEHREKLKFFPKIKTLAVRDTGRMLKIAGIISSIKKIVTKTGQPMLFIGIEDLSAKMEGLVFPSVLEKNPAIFVEGTAVSIKGRLSDKDGDLKILCEEVKEL